MNAPTHKTLSAADLNEWLEAIARMQIATQKILNPAKTITAEELQQQKKEKAKKTAWIVPVSSLLAGTYFYRQATDRREIYMRLRPTSYILNSTLVADSLSAGKSLICNVETGSTFFVLGNEPVIPLDLEG